MKVVFSVAGLCVLICGCMGPYQEEYYWAHFGSYPTNYHHLVQKWVETNFDSARDVLVSAPVRCRLPDHPLRNEPKVYGWCAGVSFEAKGAFDGYTPRQQHHIYMRDGQIVTTRRNNLEQPRTRGIAQAQYFR